METPEKIDWSKANKDNIPIEDEPEFKEGEEVEYYCVGAEKWLPAIYAFFTNNRHWIYTDGDKQDGFNMRCAWSFSRDCFRKPDPDKHLKEIAKEILIKWDFIREDGKCDPDILSMLIEALKKGKEL